MKEGVAAGHLSFLGATCISPVTVTLMGRSNRIKLPKALGIDPALTNLLNHCHYVLEKKAMLGLQF